MLTEVGSIVYITYRCHADAHLAEQYYHLIDLQFLWALSILFKKTYGRNQMCNLSFVMDRRRVVSDLRFQCAFVARFWCFLYVLKVLALFHELN